jgi:hypothetical protein
MTVLNGLRRAGTRRLNLVLAGLLAVGVLAASGTALTASAAPASGTAGMSEVAQLTSATNSHAQTGFTNGWYDGHTVRFFYSKNYTCQAPPASKASSKREAGSDYALWCGLAWLLMTSPHSAAGLSAAGGTRAVVVTVVFAAAFAFAAVLATPAPPRPIRHTDIRHVACRS